PVRCDDDRVVEHTIAARGSAAVDLIQRDAAGVILVHEIVADQRILPAVHVDARTAGDAVVVDDVPLDQRIADDAVAAFGAVAVHVDAALVVAPQDIAADDRAIAAVADVDAVL